MNVDQIIESGDRIQFIGYLEACSNAEATEAWIKATRAKVQDFDALALKTMRTRRNLKYKGR